MNGMIRTFIRHKVAANIMMILMLIAGLWALARLERQVEPDFEVPAINVAVVWPGASADDVDRNIVEALERETRFLDGVDNVTGRSREGVGELFVNYKNGTDMTKALAEVESAVGNITTLPQGAERPIINRLTIYDEIMEVMIAGPLPEPAMRALAKQMRNRVMGLGVDRVYMSGMRDAEIWVEIPAHELERLDTSIGTIAQRLGDASTDVPSGTVNGAMEKQMRALGQQQDAAGVAGLTLRVDEQGRRLTLGDVANVRETYEDNSVSGRHGGQLAIRLSLQKAKNGDLIDITEKLDAYLAELRPTLPPGVTVQSFDRNSDALEQRVGMLVDNALGGMILVVAVLAVFLRPWVTGWIVVDILVSFAVTFAIMMALGQSINMMSLFALIMMTGIICDDAIVVAEYGQTLHERGIAPEKAVERAAKRMFWPIVAAAITTIAAFAPMLLMRGTTGDYVKPLPMISIAVILASLIGCFLILPSHIKHALEKDSGPPSRLRVWFEAHFAAFRDGPFTRAIAWATHNRYATVAAALTAMLLAVGLQMGGHVPFVFSPSPEGHQAQLNVLFSPGTPRETVARQLDEAEAALARVEAAYGLPKGELVRMTFGQLGVTTGDTLPEQVGDYVGSMRVEFSEADNRSQRLPEIMQKWEAETKLLPGIDQILFTAEQDGFGGSSIGWRLVHDDPYVLKAASQELQRIMLTYGGVSGARDNLPAGKPELVVRVTPRGEALGFTTLSVGRQLRDALDGAIARRFAHGDEEVTIRVRLAEADQTEQRLAGLKLKAPGGQLVPLADVVELHERPGLSRILRAEGQRVVYTYAEVDPHKGNPGEIRQAIEKEHLPAIMEKYGVRRNMSDGSRQEAEFWADFQLGIWVALVAIYLVLAWIMGGFGRPAAVMAIIPFSVAGAIAGHWLMGADMTMWSYISIMGMAGILVNDSIQVVTSIDDRIAAGEELESAVVHGAAERLRQVMLTSLTTIFGLLPLMLETQTQAAFLVPMAITFVFGIGTATVLVLMLMPALLLTIHDAGRGMVRLRGWVRAGWGWVLRAPGHG
jgi:multidrug efflux pump subunit AcrB